MPNYAYNVPLDQLHDDLLWMAVHGFSNVSVVRGSETAHVTVRYETSAAIEYHAASQGVTVPQFLGLEQC